MVDLLQHMYQMHRKERIDRDLLEEKFLESHLYRLIVNTEELHLLLVSVQNEPFHSGKQRQRKPFSKSRHVPLLAHGDDTHSSNSNSINT